MFLNLLSLYLYCTCLLIPQTEVKSKFKPPISYFDSSISYDKMKSTVESERKKLNVLYQNNTLTLDSAGMLFTQYLVNGIMPYWYGTSWDFNGYSDTPNKGQIACGYLVSTTLKHMGIKVNRYKMAQKSAMDGALMLEKKSDLDIEYTSRDSFIAHFKKKKKDGLYMVGLSNHVGFLYLVEGKTYFIHSTYLSPSEVMCEDALASGALGYSKIFVLADISHNKQLISKWLKGEILPH
ncbi:MAG: hypothetical protein IT245_02635 [Bacteroidia bacterium]|nr:hypothetical protein [Bacteroidia bacterium]